jgi:hypothetical protein
LLITSMATKRSTTLQLLRIDTLIPNIYHPLIFIYSIDLSYLIRTSNKFLANILILYFALFSIFEYKDVQFTIFLSLLMLDLKIKLFNELLPISIWEISTFHQIVAPFHILPVVKLHNTWEPFIHKDYFSSLFTYSK